MTRAREGRSGLD